MKLWTLLSGTPMEVRTVDGDKVTLRDMELANVIIDHRGCAIKNRWGSRYTEDA